MVVAQYLSPTCVQDTEFWDASNSIQRHKESRLKLKEVRLWLSCGVIITVNDVFSKCLLCLQESFVMEHCSISSSFNKERKNEEEKLNFFFLKSLYKT